MGLLGWLPCSGKSGVKKAHKTTFPAVPASSSTGDCKEDLKLKSAIDEQADGACQDKSELPPNRDPLDWITRMKIVAGVSMGLEYLHDKVSPAPVIYRDLKCWNILLGEDYHLKLSDFGFANLGPTGDKSHVSTRVMRTYGYWAPE